MNLTLTQSFYIHNFSDNGCHKRDLLVGCGLALKQGPGCQL